MPFLPHAQLPLALINYRLVRRLFVGAYPVDATQRRICATSSSTSSPQNVTVEAPVSVSMVSKIDAFAKSRVLNFVKRSGESASCTFETKRYSVDEFRSTATLRSPRLTPSTIVASGFAATEKEAETLAAMHCERILDALGIPVFALESMQRKHAETAKAEGRYAPMPGDAPRQLSAVSLPVPLRLRSMAAATAASGPGSSEKGGATGRKFLDPFGKSGKAGSTLRSYQPTTPPLGSGSGGGQAAASGGPLKTFSLAAAMNPRDRAKQLAARAPRSGAEPFMQRGKFGVTLDGGVDLSTMDKESETLFVNEILPAEGEEGAIEADSMVQPSVQQSQAQAPLGSSLRRTVISAPDGPCAKIDVNPIVRMENGIPEQQHKTRISRPDDESEGGRYTLVDSIAVFEQFPNSLLLPSLWTDKSTPRIEKYFDVATAGTESFRKAVEITETRQHAGIARGEKAFVAVVGIPGTETIPRLSGEGGEASSSTSAREIREPATNRILARGHAATPERAIDLCAMHAELLIDQLGLLLFPNDPARQLLHADECRRAGRWAPQSADDAEIDRRRLLITAHNLRRALKEWVMMRADSPRSTRQRTRSAPFSAEERIFNAHRSIVSTMRSHCIETNVDTGYDAVGMLRQFMIDGGHQYEGLFVNHHYSPETQYRCTFHLPLPDKYGLRGGYAIGETPEIAQRFCAMHAIDVLCALGVPVLSDPADQRRLIEERRRMGLVATLPEAAANVNPHIRSPPGYRQAHHASVFLPSSRDVWNVMHLDVSDFDVCAGPPPALSDFLQLQQAFEDMLVMMGVSIEEAAKTRTLRHYYGHQRLGSRALIPANNFWMQLPLPAKKYGTRVALGRCVRRQGALRSFYVHGLRIGVALGLAGPNSEAAARAARTGLVLPSHDVRIQQRLLALAKQSHPAVAEKVSQAVSITSKPQVPSSQVRVPTTRTRSAVPQANVVIKPSTPARIDPWDMIDPALVNAAHGAEKLEEEDAAGDRDWSAVPSPNPVMSQYLAERVF